MIDCNVCPLDDRTELDKIAAEASAQTNRGSLEEAFLASLKPEQKRLWLDLEEAILQEQNLLQTLTVQKLHCNTCQNRINCELK